MCSGKGVPGNSTTSSGNKGMRAAKQSPWARKSARKNERLPDCSAALDFTSCAGIKARMELTGKVVVITGASMGIGEAIAKIFADGGASVVLLSRDAERAEAARGRIGHSERALALACDVRNREEIDRVVGLALHHFKCIDVWINNAGHGILD